MDRLVPGGAPVGNRIVAGPDDNPVSLVVVVPRKRHPAENVRFAVGRLVLDRRPREAGCRGAVSRRRGFRRCRCSRLRGRNGRRLKELRLVLRARDESGRRERRAQGGGAGLLVRGCCGRCDREPLGHVRIRGLRRGRTFDRVPRGHVRVGSLRPYFQGWLPLPAPFGVGLPVRARDDSSLGRHVTLRSLLRCGYCGGFRGHGPVRVAVRALRRVSPASRMGHSFEWCRSAEARRGRRSFAQSSCGERFFPITPSMFALYARCADVEVRSADCASASASWSFRSNRPGSPSGNRKWRFDFAFVLLAVS